MGYYSNVKFSTTEAGYEEFLSYIPDEFKDPAKWGLFGRDGVPEVYDVVGDSVIFGWDSVKWYLDWGTRTDGSDPFADVKAVMDAFNKVVDNDLNPIWYVRTGEEYMDVEESGNSCAANGDLPRYIGIENSIYIY